VSGSHAYQRFGSYSITVGINSVGGSTATANSSANVSDAPLHAGGTTVTMSPGAAQSRVVASFTDDNPFGVVGDYSATITWGDGSSASTGSIAANGQGGFIVIGSHAYAGLGTYPITVTIRNTGPSMAIANSTAQVIQNLSATGTAFSAAEGLPFSGLVATFLAANAALLAGDFTASIDWGDGQTSSGVVSANGNGGFDVTGGVT
jgi:hypothetical protein